MKSIMQLALEGKSNPEIAETLNISGRNGTHPQKKIAYRKLRCIFERLFTTWFFTFYSFF